MARGNKGFAEVVAGAAPPATPMSRRSTRPGILSGRENRLSEIARGAAVAKMNELVDPARCLIWSEHNRDYSALNEENCADLISSLKAQGRQEIPAIVRRVIGDPDHDFEVICGARRHWSVSWLRANNYPDFRFLVEPREMTDEEAFRVSDLENRSRQDLSAYERAIDYLRALDRHYQGKQQTMADRLQVSKGWLSKYLDCARLPREIVDSFGSPHLISIRNSADITPMLRLDHQRAAVIKESGLITEEQAVRAAKGEEYLPPVTVVGRLLRAGRNAMHAKPAKAAPRKHDVRRADGVLLLQGVRAPRGSRLEVTVPSAEKFSRDELVAAFAALIDELTARK